MSNADDPMLLSNENDDHNDMINMGYDLFQPIRLLVVPVFSGVHVVRDL
jgi:hypothetical protein